MEADLPVRIGIMGCAEIVRKVSRAIQLAPNAMLAAVASRSLDKAKAFAAANGYTSSVKVYGSYHSLLDDPDIDGVYIPLPTGLHIEWAVRAAMKGKHLLLEKPVALNVAEFDKIVDACEANNLQIMDATMWMHHPRTRKIQEFLSDPERFGHLKTMNSCVSFAAADEFLKNDIRVKPDLDGLGALGDIGWYAIRVTLFANNYELPKTVTALPGAVLNEAGVILSCGACLHWEDGRTATIHCSFLSHLTFSVTVIGTKGTLYLQDLGIPFREKDASFITSTRSGFNESVTGWDNLPNECHVMTELPQEACMVREFARLVGEIKNNGAKPEKFWPSISRRTQLVVDAIKESINNNLAHINVCAT